MPDPRRILDANANRAREALRVMEDGARFLLDDAELSSRAKALRHDLASALAPFAHEMLLARDTPGDVGTAISTEGEAHRASARDVVVAAGKRLTEALRTIEEYAKVIEPTVAPVVEALRYRAYDLESRLVAHLPTGGARQRRLCVLITEALCAHHAWEDVAARALDAGTDCLQLREKELDTAELCQRAGRLVELARPTGADVFVNDRIDVALGVGATGVHLGQRDLPLAHARRLAGDRLLVGVSTRTLDDVRRARAGGADVIGIGPMFPSTTKPRPDIAGPEHLSAVLALDPAPPPHLAIGGVTPENAPELARAGARGIAVSSCVCAAIDPGAVCEKLLEALDTAPNAG
jgi:thiamine-phosphate pyrophosphorylase